NSSFRHIEKGSKMEASLSNPILNFSVDLYKQLKPSGKDTAGNVFCSPFSIAAALSMALAGARGNTAKQIAAILHSNDDKIHNHFSSFLCKLPSYAPDVALHIANRMYSEQTFHPKAEYTTLLQKSYDSTIKAVDFAGNADRVRQEVNAWVEEATRSKIRDLLAPGTVDASTSLILVNAIYFKGLWDSQFKPSATKPEDFHLTPQTSKTVDMMHQKGDFKMGHCSDLKVTALEIPYKGNKMSMIILLPEDVEGLSVLEEHLTAPKLSALLGGMNVTSDVNLRLPKFKLEQSIGLKDVLMAMGLKDFFTSLANLSGISATENLCASDVIHKAFVEVNEEGTEAAAATAIPIMLCCAIFPEVVNFFVDHPFMFLIHSHDPDVVLFMGSIREL
ncbi:unnamed protein product, partial [Ixodes pacificus]